MLSFPQSYKLESRRVMDVRFTHPGMKSLILKMFVDISGLAEKALSTRLEVTVNHQTF